MAGYENIISFYIILNKMFNTGKNIKIKRNYTIDVIGYEKSDEEGMYITHTEVEIRKPEDLYKCYEKEICDFREFFVQLQKRQESKYDSILMVANELISNIDNLLENCELVTQTKYKKINFEKVNVVETKNLILKLIFKMSYTFDKLLELLEAEYIKRYYKGRSIYNWVLYILNTLCNNAFKDATTDKDGRISLETIKYICYLMFQTNEIVSRSNRNIVNRIFL